MNKPKDVIFGPLPFVIGRGKPEEFAVLEIAP
jgi:hypothetical protein